MNIAILGTDADAVRLAGAAVAAGHRIVWVGDVRPQEASAISELAPRLNDSASEWELLLDRAIADGIIIGRGTAGDDLRAEQLKRIATEGVPLLAVHPATSSILPYYEVDMVRRETGGIARHYNPLAGHSVVTELAAWVRDGHPFIGTIHQVTCERQLHEAARSDVLRHLARDVELIAAIAGDIRRVSAIGPETADASHASLQVQMTTDGPASLRWAVGSPTTRGPGLGLTLIGERGTVVLAVLDDAALGDSREWHLETAGGGASEQELLPAYDAPLVGVGQFAAAVAEAELHRRAAASAWDGAIRALEVVDVEEEDLHRRAAASTWDRATRAMEVVDAVELSLQKGRMIDVYQQRLTERLAFRGRMAAIGCGLLLISFVVLVAMAILGGAERPGGNPLFRSWGVLLLAVLAFFLLLQALPLLAAKLKPRR